jgi:signal transduction histidine kinase
VDIIGIIEDTVLQLRNHPRIAGRSLRFDRPPERAVIAGDPQRLKQVFLNLGTNAIEATDPGTGQIRVSLRRCDSFAANRRRAGERRMVAGIEVEFADDGLGLAEAQRKLLFTPFFTTKESGHGLGLTIVHRIVQDHLGKVDVESAPGEGARFQVWFPLMEERSHPEAAKGVEVRKEMVHV